MCLHAPEQEQCLSKGTSPENCSQARLQRTCKEPQEQFLGVALSSHIWLRLLAIARGNTQAKTFLKGRAMVFLRQESTGRSGNPSRLRDKLLLFNARTGLSQQGLARFVGVSTAALRNWEAGQSKPTSQNLKRLIEIYFEYRAFVEGEECTEAADLWEAAQERGLKLQAGRHRGKRCSFKHGECKHAPISTS